MKTSTYKKLRERIAYLERASNGFREAWGAEMAKTTTLANERDKLRTRVVVLEDQLEASDHTLDDVRRVTQLASGICHTIDSIIKGGP